MSAIDYLEQTNAQQMRDFTEELLRQVSRLRDQYLTIDKSAGVTFTAFVIENAERAKEELATASDLNAIRDIARRVLKDARNVEQLLQNYY